MRILLTVISFLHLLGLQAAAYYISPNGKDTNAGNRWFVPFRTFERAVSALRPGDTLNIMKGDYFSDADAIIDIDKSGREQAWIVVKNYLNHKPVLHVKTKYGVRLKSANYVSIEGLQIKPESFYGGNQPVSDAELSGIFLDGTYAAPCRHIKIYNNYVLNFSGAGLLARYYDYLVLSYNKFFRNGIGDNTYGAIYLDHGLNTDEKEIYHNFVQANTLEKNSLPDSGKSLPCKPFLYMRFDSAQAPHRDARTLIHNNIAYTNGGGGILIEQATGVRIVHNTLYKNALLANCGGPEVEIRNCRHIDVQNNIFYPFDDKTASRVVQSDSARFRNNLNYNTGSFVKGMNDVRTEPQFEDIREKENLFNFRLKGNSPAINAGVDEFLSDIDFEGNQRKIDTHTDLGAVEFANRILPSLKNLKMSAGSKGITSKWTSLYTKDQKMYTIWNEQNESFMVKVYNPLGEVIHEQRELVPGAFSFELDMSGYPSGYYTIVSYNVNGSHKDRIEVKSR